MNKVRRIRVGGVPEHFNEPWAIGLEKGYFEHANIDLQWISIAEGTGAMINKLKSDELDIIVALTEGLINEISGGQSTLTLLGTYVQSSLRWSISVSLTSNYQNIEDLKGKIFGISRLNSGSHLMSCVLGSQYGWKKDDIQFKIKDNFQNLRHGLRDNDIDGFIWEYFMQKPFYDRGEMRRLGEISTPWPCFLIASRKDFVNDNFTILEDMFDVLKRCCEEFHMNHENTTINRVVEKFHLNTFDATDWFNEVRIVPTRSISKSTIETAIDALTNASILSHELKNIESIEFIDWRFSKIYFDIKSMRLYNKPELLISLRNNLRSSGLSKGALSYQELLPFDQNHYYGTEVLDLAVEKLGLNNAENLDRNSSKWIIQIGSNLAGCARYLAGRYGLRVLAIELQNDLSQAASELTDRCGLNHLIHHLAGNFLTVSEHLQENYYHSIVSWLTILHFQEHERKDLFRKTFRLIEHQGYFYLEDFIQIGDINEKERKILENDVFCHYLPPLEDYKNQLIQVGYEIIETEDLTSQWQAFTEQRFRLFSENENTLIKIHGNDIYSRLKYFYQAIAELFRGNHVGGVRIVAQKPK